MGRGSAMIMAGLKLTVLGMGVVTCFLLLLILIVHISHRLLAGQTVKELSEIEAGLRKRKGSVPVKEDNVLIAVISAALAAHRRREK